MPALTSVRRTPRRAVSLIERGFPWREAAALAADLGVPLERLAALLDIPSATFFRRRRTRFTRQESDRLVRFRRLWWLACDVFEDDDGARSWLKTGQIGLGGACRSSTP